MTSSTIGATDDGIPSVATIPPPGGDAHTETTTVAALPDSFLHEIRTAVLEETFARATGTDAASTRRVAVFDLGSALRRPAPAATPAPAAAPAPAPAPPAYVATAPMIAPGEPALAEVDIPVDLEAPLAVESSARREISGEDRESGRSEELDSLRSAALPVKPQGSTTLARAAVLLLALCSVLAGWTYAH